MHIFISPHPDDVAGSCGASIAKWVSHGEKVLVYTVFGSDADGPFSDFALELHEAWAVDGSEAASIRREEDKKALRSLGAEVIFGRFADAIYRRSETGSMLYTNTEMIFGEINPFDFKVIGEVCNSVKKIAEGKNTRIYAPLAIGSHVDHQLMFKVGMDLLDLGMDVWFYEDFVYSYDHFLYIERMSSMPHWQAVKVEIDYIHLEQKITALRCYSSQILFLFDSFEDLYKKVTMFALTNSSNLISFSELYWKKI